MTTQIWSEPTPSSWRRLPYPSEQRIPRIALLLVAAWLISACDSADREKRAGVARLETMETEMRLQMQRLAQLETARDELLMAQAQAEQEEQLARAEHEAIITTNPLIAASLGGAGSALQEYEISQAQQREMDGGTALAGLLAGAYLLMNPQETASVLAESQLLEQRTKDVNLRRAGIARELEEKDLEIRTTTEKLIELQTAINAERSRL